MGRLDLAEQALDRLEAMLSSGAMRSENLRLMKKEIATLRRHRPDDPARAEALIHRATDFADRLRWKVT